MPQDLLERARTSIQRDRLSEFLKKSRDIQSGCFYYSLLMVWEHLNPNKSLPKDIDEAILKHNPNLSVYTSEIVTRTQQLEKYLNLKVIEILVPTGVTQNNDEMRVLFNAPASIKITRENDKNVGRKTNIGEMIHLVPPPETPEIAHFVSAHKSLRFLGDEISGGNVGGQEGFDSAIKDGYKYDFIIRFSKI